MIWVWTHPTMNVPLPFTVVHAFSPVAVVCLHRIRASRHHHHFFVSLLVTIVSTILDPSCTYAQVRCCESYDSVLVHRACCPRVSESQPHPTFYIKLDYIQQHSTKTQNRIWMIIFESYLASCLSL
jgi:hypothetical protein